MLERGRGKLACVLYLLFSQTACDIVQGLRDANDAIFPAEKVYFDAPGYRLATGGYRSLDFALGTSAYLLARSSAPEETSLYSMLYADPKPCALPNIGAYQPGGGVFNAATVIVYIEEGGGQGTLRFADANCSVYDIAVPNSALPVLETPVGFAAYEGADLVLVNPVTGTKRLLMTGGQYFGRIEAFTIAYDPGDPAADRPRRFLAFNAELNEAGAFGEGIAAAGFLAGSLFFEDAKGIHRLESSGGDSPTLVDTLLAPGGCVLSSGPPLGAAETWITYYASCNPSQKLTAYGVGSRHAAPLGFEADPRHLALLPAWPNVAGDPAVDPFYFALLRDVDPMTGLGTLVLRTPKQTEVEIGRGAPLDRVTLVSNAGETHGYALLGVADGVGRYVRWQEDGSAEELANSAIRDTGDLVTRAEDGSVDFLLLEEGGAAVVGQRLPPGTFKFRDANNRWTAFLDQYDGAAARLSLTASTLSFAESAKSPTAPPVLETLAEGVVPDGRIQFVRSLPGIAYLTHHDVEHNIGRLEYRNIELRFTAQVSEGVSDYISTADGLIYSVPFGAGAGIWFTRSR